MPEPLTRSDALVQDFLSYADMAESNLFDGGATPSPVATVKLIEAIRTLADALPGATSPAGASADAESWLQAQHGRFFIESGTAPIARQALARTFVNHAQESGVLISVEDMDAALARRSL